MGSVRRSCASACVPTRTVPCSATTVPRSGPSMTSAWYFRSRRVPVARSRRTTPAPGGSGRVVEFIAGHPTARSVNLACRSKSSERAGRAGWKVSQVGAGHGLPRRVSRVGRRKGRACWAVRAWRSAGESRGCRRTPVEAPAERAIEDAQVALGEREAAQRETKWRVKKAPRISRSRAPARPRRWSAKCAGRLGPTARARSLSASARSTAGSPISKPCPVIDNGGRVH